VNKFIQHIIRFVFLVLLQVLILNNIQFSGYINPFVYILFILLLPPKLPKALLLVLAFTMGLTMDMFSDSLGVHTAASVLIAYIRPGVLGMITTKGGEELETIGIKQLRFTRFFTYAAILTFIHHFTLFYIEAFRISEFLATFSRAFISSICSLLLILIIESLRSNSLRK